MSDIIKEIQPQFGEPWELSRDGYILGKDERVILGGIIVPDPGEKERIVECVNACAELDTTHVQQLRNHALTLNCTLNIQRQMGILGENRPSPESLELFLKLTWGVTAKVSYP